MKFILSLLIITFIFSGCIPKSGTYYKFETTYEGKYIHDSCYGVYGKPSTFFFFYNGIYLSVNTYSLNGILLGVHIPKNNTVQLLEKNLTFLDDKENKYVSILKPRAQNLLRTAPKVYKYWKDPYLYNEDYFAELQGDSTLYASDKYSYKWYLFSTDYFIKNDGTIILPKLKINGKVYDNIKLEIKQDEYFKIDGFNC